MLVGGLQNSQPSVRQIGDVVRPDGRDEQTHVHRRIGFAGRYLAADLSAIKVFEIRFDIGQTARGFENAPDRFPILIGEPVDGIDDGFHIGGVAAFAACRKLPVPVFPDHSGSVVGNLGIFAVGAAFGFRVGIESPFPLGPCVKREQHRAHMLAIRVLLTIRA